MEHLLPNGPNGNLTSNLFRAVVIVNKMEYLLPKDQNGYFTSNLIRAVFIVNKMEINLINGYQNGIFTSK